MESLLCRAGAEASHCMGRTKAARNLAGRGRGYRSSGSVAVAERFSVVNLINPDSSAKKLCLQCKPTVSLVR
jgi:hypothetical protein